MPTRSISMFFIYCRGVFVVSLFNIGSLSFVVLGFIE